MSEPIMEARKLAELIWANWHAPDETYRQSENRSAALIQSRDDAIRAEERERVIDECKAAIHAGDWRGDGGWGPFINKTLDSLKERTDADAE
jgi:hypothetical protein